MTLLKGTPDSVATDSVASEDSPVVRRLQPSAGWVSLNLRELWEYRELFYFIVWRDFKVRYKQTVLGALWAIIQPVSTMLVFSIFLGRLAKVPSDGIPYPIFTYSGLLPWNLFASGMVAASMSLVISSHLIPKVYFPRLVLPASGVISGLVDFALAFLVLIAMMIWSGTIPTINVIWLPFFLALAMCSALGIGLWLAAINVYYRDVMYLVPFVVQLWMFATPVVYPSSLLVEPWRTIYGLNPMVGVVEGFRWALLGTDTAPGRVVLVSSLVSLAALISGLFVFRRMEKKFVDMI
jgi:lipopolysaccharide transport system permease protein